MRRTLHIAFVFIWSLSIAGVVVSKHYCGPFLKSIELGHSPAHCCADMDETDEPNECCKNILEYRSLEDSFLKGEKIAGSFPILFVLYSVEPPAFRQVYVQDSPASFYFKEDTGPSKPPNPPYIAFGALLI